MASPRDVTRRTGSGWRAVATSYRTRLFLAIFLVVSVALLLVLFSLPRLLETFFREQEEQDLDTRADTMALLIAAELSQAAREAPTRPILQLDGAATMTTRNTLGDAESGFVRNLAEQIAQADVTVEIAPAGAETSSFRLDVPVPEEVARPGQGRDAISATASVPVDDVYYAPSSDVSPNLTLSVSLRDPFTLRAETARTITEVLVTAALIALVVTLITALLLAQWLARPVRRLTQTSRLLAEGHLEARVDIPANSAPEVHELARAFNHMAERLQASVAIISEDRDRSREFLADVSHELRTPIAALRTFNELLLEGAAEEPDTRDEFLRQSRQQVERLDWLAANLLQLSKLDSGLVSLELRDDDLRVVVEDAVDHAVPMADRKGVSLRTNLPPAPVMQPHDPPRLGQVLSNLIGNAIKFTPAGGHVEVSVEPTEDGARLQVADDGVGIDADELEHVFDRFYRGTRTPEERAGGSGLGLAIARSIVDMHRGRVAISSTPDVGTRVVVTLPRDVSDSSSSDLRG